MKTPQRLLTALRSICGGVLAACESSWLTCIDQRGFLGTPRSLGLVTWGRLGSRGPGRMES
jgi:hypothetical protein